MLEKYLEKINNETNVEDEINILKAELLESKKPSLKEPILYFLESELKNIPSGFSKTSFNELNVIPYIAKRSLLSICQYRDIQSHIF